MLDFVDPAGAGRRSRCQDWLGWDDEPGRKGLEFHGPKKIGRRSVGNNELSVVFYEKTWEVLGNELTGRKTWQPSL